ncbi:MAG: hypothetical protein KIH69_017205 [Anaerolineae bacterium]|nr:hypothetical protein [Anaerolineae bacterium]
MKLHNEGKIDPNVLAAELHRRKIYFVNAPAHVSTYSAQLLSDERLLQGLILCDEARLRLALIPLLMLHSGCAQVVDEAISKLNHPLDQQLKLYSDAASMFKQKFQKSLSSVSIAGYTNDEMLDQTYNQKLKGLEQKYQAVTGLNANWGGMVEQAAKQAVKIFWKAHQIV